MADRELYDMGVCGLIIAIMLRQRRRRRKKKRNVWTRQWILNRPRFGAFHQLVQELRLTDSPSYINFLRMDISSFEELLELVRPVITYTDTNMRQAISAGERLALTLRFLATGTQVHVYNNHVSVIITYVNVNYLHPGENFSSLQYLYRIPPQTISMIIPETCEAISRA